MKTLNITLAALLLLLALAGCGRTMENAPKVVVIGIDGLDPKLLQIYVDEGRMPNFESLMREGDFRPLQTCMPPLSPIAWSTFITGMDAGGHGVFDFVQRDPDTLEPYSAMARETRKPGELGVGSYVVPYRGGKVENLRKGRAFWQILEEHGVPTTVFRMPANYPPVESEGKTFSGMGTPDLQGTSGTFSYYTTIPWAGEVTGGKVYVVEVEDGHVHAAIEGPTDPVRRRWVETREGEGHWVRDPLLAEFDLYIDPEEPVARLDVGGVPVMLKEGEWSPWVAVSFDAVPYLASVSGIGRFYLKQVRPDLQLYVTPIQIDPADPAQTISTPGGWSRELYDRVGRFYTQELPEDTKALTYGVFTGEDFWEQAQFVYRERRRALDLFLETYEEGLLFFYFSSVDQGCHMLWQYFDPEHPSYEENEKLREGIRILYEEMDEALGAVLEAIDEDTTLIVMSDHGFAPFYWGVNLNTWLLEKGYVTLKDPSKQGRYPLFANVDWSRTTAYAVGLNGLYVNLEGRERDGVVPESEYEAMLERLERDLLEMVDPRTGRHPVTLVTRTRRDLHGPYADSGPDIIVGYSWGYRTSWESPLGEFPKEVFVDNTDAWSGDHSMDYRVVPGVLLSNRPITLDEPALYDVTVAILDEYGIEKPPEMIGEDCLGDSKPDPVPDPSES